MKKLLCFCLILCLILTASINCYAFSYAEESVDTHRGITISEKEVIENLQSKSDTDLVKMGYTNREIQTIRKIDDEYALEILKSLSTEELKLRGYTTDQIKRIKSNKIGTLSSDEIYGEVTYTIDLTSIVYYSNTDETVLETKASWEWSKFPVCAYTDIIACTTNLDDFTVSTTRAYAHYHKNANSSVVYYSAELNAKIASKKHCVYVNIPMTKDGEGIVPHLAKTGFLSVTWTAGGRHSIVTTSAKYGHNMGLVNTQIPTAYVSNHSIYFTPSDDIGTGAEATVTARL